MAKLAVILTMLSLGTEIMGQPMSERMLPAISGSLDDLVVAKIPPPPPSSCGSRRECLLVKPSELHVKFPGLLHTKQDLHKVMVSLHQPLLTDAKEKSGRRKPCNDGEVPNISSCCITCLSIDNVLTTIPDPTSDELLHVINMPGSAQYIPQARCSSGSKCKRCVVDHTISYILVTNIPPEDWGSYPEGIPVWFHPMQVQDICKCVGNGRLP